MKELLISLEKKKIFRVFYGQNLRAGFATLNQIFSVYLGIDVHKGAYVVTNCSHVAASKPRILFIKVTRYTLRLFGLENEFEKDSQAKGS